MGSLANDYDRRMPSANYPAPGSRRSGSSGDVRHHNLTQVLRYVRDHGPSSRHDIAHGCGLGISTMTDLVGELRHRRLVRELDPVRRTGAGRPTRPLEVDGDPWVVLGVHLDLDHIRVRAATVGGLELWRDEVPVDLRRLGAPDGVHAVLAVVRAQLGHLDGTRDLVAVQLALPGRVGRGGLVVSEALGWASVALTDRVGAALAARGHRNVHVGAADETQLAALHAARTELDLPSDSIVAYLGGSRAVSTAVVVDGEIYLGASGAGGDFGHAHVDPTGPACRCGRHGCLQSFAGPAAVLVAGDLLTTREADQLVLDQPEKALRLVVEAAAAGDARVLTALQRAGRALGHTVDDVVGILNPDAVVLGGYLGALAGWLLPAVQLETLGAGGPTAFPGTRVVALPSRSGRSVAGALLAARDACFSDPLTLTQRLSA
ncbi:MAG: putative NagC family transcriptional regulator [Friedmanniella sp.]|nr:putative NagC family transcriptional regulator [Friedmanniella sp.]